MSDPQIVYWGNVPVPYTATWTGEYPLGAKIRKVPELGNYPFCCELVSTPGVGKPQFSYFHVGRAVEVMAKTLCQICLRKLPADGEAPFAIGFGNTINGYPHINDGLPMCRSCCALTLDACPRLKALYDHDQNSLHVYQVKGFGLAPAILGPMDPAKGGRPEVNTELARWKRHYGDGHVFGSPKIYLTSFTRLDIQAFLIRGRAERALKERN